MKDAEMKVYIGAPETLVGSEKPVDKFAKTEAAPLNDAIEVSQAKVNDKNFRFFENYRFVFLNDDIVSSAA